jgi:hypothetical protein
MMNACPHQSPIEIEMFILLAQVSQAHFVYRIRPACSTGFLRLQRTSDGGALPSVFRIDSIRPFGSSIPMPLTTASDQMSSISFPL